MAAQRSRRERKILRFQPPDTVDPSTIYSREETLERPFQREVEKFAQSVGWKTYSIPDQGEYDSRTGGRRYARRSSPGFPDLLCLRNGYQLVIEFKSMRKGHKPTPDQEAWLAEFVKVAERSPGNTRVHVFRRSDSEKVYEILINWGKE